MAKDDKESMPPKDPPGAISNILKQETNAGIKEQISNQDTIDSLSKIQEARSKALDLIAAQNSNTNQRNLENIDKIEKAVNSGKLTEAEINNRLDELSKIIGVTNLLLEKINTPIETSAEIKEQISNQDISSKIEESKPKDADLVTKQNDETGIGIKDIVENISSKIEESKPKDADLVAKQNDESKKDLKNDKESLLPKDWTGGISNILKQTQETSAGIKKQISEQDRLSKIQEAKSKALDLVAMQNSEVNQRNLENIEKIENAISSGKLTDAQINNRLAELSEIINTVDLSLENIDKSIGVDETAQSIRELTKSQDRQLEIKATEEMSKEIATKLTNLGGLFGSSHNKTTEQLKESFSESNKNLRDAIESGDHEKIKLARAQMEGILSSAEKEEELRKQKQSDKESNSLLLKTATGISNLGDKFEGIAKGITSKAGFFAKLIPIALMILSQIDRDKFEKVFTWLKEAIIRIVDVVRGVVNILTGDTEKGMETLKNNIGTVAFLIVGLALMFAGPIVKVLKFIAVGIKFLYKGLSIVMAIMKGVISVAALKVIAIVGAIGLALFGLYKLFEYIKERLKLDSMKDMFKVILASLQDAVGHMLNFFINIINGITGFVSKYGSRILKFFKIDWEPPNLNIAEMATDNAEKAIAESRRRRTQRELEEQPEERIDDIESDQAPRRGLFSKFSKSDSESDGQDDLGGLDLSSLGGFDGQDDLGGIDLSSLGRADNMGGFNLDDLSIENSNLTRGLGNDNKNTNIVSAPVTTSQDNRNNVTTVIQQPSSRTSALMSNYAFAR
jgi:hypothetical protein